jgi:hypothetical protein
MALRQDNCLWVHFCLLSLSPKTLIWIRVTHTHTHTHTHTRSLLVLCIGNDRIRTVWLLFEEVFIVLLFLFFTAILLWTWSRQSEEHEGKGLKLFYSQKKFFARYVGFREMFSSLKVDWDCPTVKNNCLSLEVIQVGQQARGLSSNPSTAKKTVWK